MQNYEFVVLTALMVLVLKNGLQVLYWSNTIVWIEMCFKIVHNWDFVPSISFFVSIN